MLITPTRQFILVWSYRPVGLSWTGSTYSTMVVLFASLGCPNCKTNSANSRAEFYQHSSKLGKICPSLLSSSFPEQIAGALRFPTICSLFGWPESGDWARLVHVQPNGWWMDKQLFHIPSLPKWLGLAGWLYAPNKGEKEEKIPTTWIKERKKKREIRKKKKKRKDEVDKPL